MILPVSAVSISASAGTLSAMRSARRYSSLPRWVAVRSAQAASVKARCAAFTARSVPSRPASGMSAQTSPVEGSRLSKERGPILETAVDIVLELAHRSAEGRETSIDEAVGATAFLRSVVMPESIRQAEFVVAQGFIGLEAADHIVGRAGHRISEHFVDRIFGIASISSALSSWISA